MLLLCFIYRLSINRKDHVIISIALLDFEAEAKAWQQAIKHLANLEGQITTLDAAPILPEKSVVFLELHFPHSHAGLMVARQLQLQRPDLTLVVWTLHPHQFSIWAANALHLSGFLDKSLSCEEFKHSLQALRVGQSVWSCTMLSKVREWEQQVAHKLRHLQPLQWQVWQSIMTGNSNEQIADMLRIPRSSLGRYLSDLYLILGVRSRVDAVLLVNQWDLAVEANGQYVWTQLVAELFPAIKANAAEKITKRHK